MKAIHTPTKEKFKAVIDKLNYAGIKEVNDSNPEEFTFFWDNYKENTVILLQDKFCYTDIEMAKRWGIQVVSFELFMN